MSPPWPLADTARLPFTRNARPPNIRCSRTPSSPATSARIRAASSSSYATREACRKQGRRSHLSPSLVTTGDDSSTKGTHTMSVTATRPTSPEATEAPPEAPWPEPLPSYDPLAGNPVARAHARRGGASSAAEGSPIGRILLWTVAIPAIIFLRLEPARLADPLPHVPRHCRPHRFRRNPLASPATNRPGVAFHR